MELCRIFQLHDMNDINYINNKGKPLAKFLFGQ
jgi:hypothetical protein